MTRASTNAYAVESLLVRAMRQVDESMDVPAKLQISPIIITINTQSIGLFLYQRKR